MAFSSVRENVTPTQLEIVLENVIVHYILLIIYNFNFVFYYIIVTNIWLLLWCYNGSLIEMNQIIIFIIGFYWYYVWLMIMWQMLLSPGLVL